MIPAVLERCAGIDVHKKFVVACVLVGAAHMEPEREVRRFSTFNADLAKLRDWLLDRDCKQVAMESTGVYWRPVFNVLEEAGIEAVVANPQQVKNLRGHKTDLRDCRWLAHLFRHGMIRPSYIPPRPIRDLRDLTRRRKQLVRNGAMERNRVQRLLEEANIKLGNVLSDVFGVSGQHMLEALVKGRSTPAQMAQLARRRLRSKIPAIQAALEGHRLTPTQRDLIQQCMQHMAYLEQQIEQVDQQIQEKIQQGGFTQAYELLQTVPGFKQEAAATVLAEVGADVNSFPSAAKLSSWAGVCPGNNETGGKRKSTRTTKGNPHLRDLLLEAAWASAHRKNSQMQNRYRRLQPRKGHKRAIVAVAHSLVHAIYYVLSTRKPFLDTAEPPRKATTVQRLIRHHTRRLKKLSCWLQSATQHQGDQIMENQRLTS
jgi:transposase